MDIKLFQLQIHGDERGSLVSLEDKKNVPFAIARVFYLYRTADGVRRGFHAHKSLQQLVVSVTGTCRFSLDDGREKIDILLDNPEQALYLGPRMWHEMYDFSEDCVLLVLASSIYDEADYIRNYDDFLKHIETTNAASIL